MESLKILHILGSPTDYFNFNLSVMYAGSFASNIADRKYSSSYAIVRPDGYWSFVDELAGVKFFENLEIENGQDYGIEITAALQHIKFVIKPDLALVHFLCLKGITAYRALFDALEIPLIGGTTESRHLCMDKLKTRNTLLADQSVPCAEGFVHHKGDSVTLGKVFYPCVVKASKGEDTKGVRLAKDQQSFLAALEHALSFSDQVIVERFIEGREIRCAVVESVRTGQLKALSCIEYNVRQDDIRKTEDKLMLNEMGLPLGKVKVENWFLDPAKEGDLTSRIQHYSCQAFKALGLKDFGIFDFRVDHNGSPFLLECNLFCSFGPQSALNAIAKDSGFTDKELFDLMVDNALLRRKNPLNGFHSSKKLIDA